MDVELLDLMARHNELQLEFLKKWQELEDEYDVVFPDGIFDQRKDYDILGSVSAELVEIRRELELVGNQITEIGMPV